MKRHHRCPDCGFVDCVCDELEETELDEEDFDDFDRDELGADPEDDDG